MGVEHLQQFNVRGDDADEVSLVFALQLGRAKTAQDGKDTIPQQGQQFEGDEMVAGLFAVAQHAPQQGAKANQQEQCRKGETLFHAQGMQCGKSAEHGDGCGAKVPQKPQKHSKAHIPGQRFYQTNQPCHYLNPRALHPTAPFP